MLLPTTVPQQLRRGGDRGQTKEDLCFPLTATCSMQWVHRSIRTTALGGIRHNLCSACAFSPADSFCLWHTKKGHGFSELMWKSQNTTLQVGLFPANQNWAKQSARPQSTDGLARFRLEQMWNSLKCPLWPFGSLHKGQPYRQTCNTDLASSPLWRNEMESTIYL